MIFESWHVGGKNREHNSAPVEQEEQIMNVIATTQTITEATTESVDGTADLVIPAIEAATTEKRARMNMKWQIRLFRA